MKTKNSIPWYDRRNVRAVSFIIAVLLGASLIFTLYSRLLLLREQAYTKSLELKELAQRVEEQAMSLTPMDPPDTLSFDHPAYMDLLEDYIHYNRLSRVYLMNMDHVVQADSSFLFQADENEKIVEEAFSGRQRAYTENGMRKVFTPVRQRDGQTIGVLAAYVPLDELNKGAVLTRRYILPLFFILIMGIFVLFVLWQRYDSRPLMQIISWLEKKADGQAGLKPERRYKDEHQLVVDAVETITGDLMDLDSNRRTFVSNVSHELKTPLSSMKVLTEALLLQDNVPEEMYKEFLGDINDEIDRQNEIISDLLTLVRLDAGENQMNIQVHDLVELTERILNRLRPLAGEKNVTLEMDIRDNVLLQCDEMKITLALSNLIENGIKYNRENGKVIVRINAGVREAFIDIEDTGIGIPKEHFGRIFDRFYRVNAARDRGTGGTGLGLSIVRQVIQMHHGTISLDSEPGSGTTFHIVLPLKYMAAREVHDDVR